MIIRWIKFQYFWIMGSDKIRIAYHEAGHAVIAELFSEKLFMNFITINEEVSRQFHESHRGGLAIEFFTQPSSQDYEVADNIILIALAGMCAQTIYKKGKDFVKDNLGNFHNNMNLLVYDGCGGDKAEWDKQAKELSEVYTQVAAGRILLTAVRFVFEYFLNENVWKAIDSLAKDLIASPNEYLTDKEIKDSFTKIEFDKVLAEHRDAFLQKRYPLRFETFKDLV